MDSKLSFLLGITLLVITIIVAGIRFANRIKPSDKGLIICVCTVGTISSLYFAWMIVFISQYRLM
ncbi:hypothetical protein TUBRATIS_14050 [Tubulinosema ratisbonensis]|uniref:Uncharacterized protein n=1 Tax=Tubulinosema ratisbonensis TaxID=291195 RepID=A0A437AM11_9MICR|nr:hypothetical protein TUBRATIS_14050 [Tubulinosema ratisbonensis]